LTYDTDAAESDQSDEESQHSSGKTSPTSRSKANHQDLWRIGKE
jgi:hypothetical protein